ncbi:DUF3237 domain-containing protein [Gracilibacillus kekensis]|uniref:UPF0311 protein SAMN05216179_3199 n=1 Tax=Gracilibacillus kekensis TaxID=1027249 RepID=A0A1M7QI01_9BACI|nr:DUF3237 domain-containing protein [Gracilibacillus kekensis]SHN30684.1 Protein of unknown function [Gracilibacillus kekensis]
MELEKIMEVYVECSEPMEIGDTPKGFLRVIPIVGGTFEGSAIKGSVVPGGADWNTVREDGSTEVWARYTLETDDGTLISIINEGVHGSNGEDTIWTHPSFLTPISSRYSWLNEKTLIGKLEPLQVNEGLAVKLHFYCLE